jgi:hypothetical protein
MLVSRIGLREREREKLRNEHSAYDARHVRADDQSQMWWAWTWVGIRSTVI